MLSLDVERKCKEITGPSGLQTLLVAGVYCSVFVTVCHAGANALQQWHLETGFGKQQLTCCMLIEQIPKSQWTPANYNSETWQARCAA